MLHLYPLNELISNVMPATGLNEVDTGATKAEKASNFQQAEKIQLGEHLATN